MGIRYNLATRTVKNTGTEDITLMELIEIVTTLAPGVEKTLEQSTKIYEVQS